MELKKIYKANKELPIIDLQMNYNSKLRLWQLYKDQEVLMSERQEFKFNDHIKMNLARMILKIYLIILVISR